MKIPLQIGNNKTFFLLRQIRQFTGKQPTKTISAAKIHRMGTAFQRYLSDNGINSNMVPMRLDAVVIDGDTINWLKNIAQ